MKRNQISHIAHGAQSVLPLPGRYSSGQALIDPRVLRSCVIDLFFRTVIAKVAFPTASITAGK